MVSGQRILRYGVGPTVAGSIESVCDLWAKANGIGQMTVANRERLDTELRRIDAMSGEELSALIHGDECPYPAEHLVGLPLGMFHCPLCGEMILAGALHTRSTDLTDLDPPEDGNGFRDY